VGLRLQARRGREARGLCMDQPRQGWDEAEQQQQAREQAAVWAPGWPRGARPKRRTQLLPVVFTAPSLPEARGGGTEAGRSKRETHGGCWCPNTDRQLESKIEMCTRAVWASLWGPSHRRCASEDAASARAATAAAALQGCGPALPWGGRQQRWHKQQDFEPTMICKGSVLI